MDLLLLVMTRRILKCTATHWRILAGAVLGATLASCSLFLMELPYFLWVLAAYGVTGMLMVKVCFSFRSLSRTLTALTCLFGGTLLLGGAYTAVLVQIPYFHKNGFLFVQIIGIGSFFCFSFTRIMSKIHRKRRSHIYSVTLVWNGRTVQVRALWDTGNTLTDPINGAPVTVLEADCIREWIGELRENGVRVIPYHTLGVEKGYLEGLKIEKMSWYQEDADRVTNIAGPLIGLYEGTLTNSGTYQMILPGGSMQQDAGMKKSRKEGKRNDLIVSMVQKGNLSV